MTEFKTGQKWISNAEPELGIGRIVRLEERLLTIQFDRVEEIRTYARKDAPLSRVKFAAGDQVRTTDGIEITVDQVIDKDGLLFYSGNYQGTDTLIVETELDPNVTFAKPEERLLTQQLDDNAWFNLRYFTLHHLARLAASPAKGLLGPRVALIPHQFYVAAEIANRYAPRVLLADEVGLGKTIEAGLIVHRQLTTGRAERILVIVPPALTFQWFVEMIRRFNLQFTILDEERCLDIEADNRPEFEDDEPGLDNPFEAQQLVLCSLDLFLDNPERLVQGAEAEWDLIIIDEAHHLHWEDGNPGEDYLAVEHLASAAKGLLLLTATPEQLGRVGHFSRLRLLDASRYHDYDTFVEEESGFEDIAALALDIADDGITNENRSRAITRLGEHAPDNDDELLNALLDRHGTGRVLFRNVRASTPGFKQRSLQSYEIDQSTTDWLIELLQTSEEKYLVICSAMETAITLEKALRAQALRSVAFHEGMDLIARDRAANYFADTDRGAQVLVCSEIGSEGRNFQFAHHLIMFDLPANPDLLEQRIGRLDRIGQTEDITIHVPYRTGDDQAALLRLYDEGLGIFTAPNAAAQFVFERLPALASDNVDDVVSQARQESQARLEELQGGQDKMLALNSHRPEVSAQLLSSVNDIEVDGELEAYMERSFDLFGLESDVLNATTFSVKPTESMVRHSSVSAETQDRFRYPELPEEGLSYTFDRDTALAREDVHFLTWENPIVQQALDLVVSDVTGNSSAVVVKLAGVPAGTLLLETLHVIECSAPKSLDAPRYLPPLVLRSLVTPKLQDLSAQVAFSEWPDTLQIAKDALAKIVASQEDGIKQMIAAANGFAEEKSKSVRTEALATMDRELQAEISRLRYLSEVNPNVSQSEIEYLSERHTALTEAIKAAPSRLDALRVIITA